MDRQRKSSKVPFKKLNDEAQNYLIEHDIAHNKDEVRQAVGQRAAEAGKSSAAWDSATREQVARQRVLEGVAEYRAHQRRQDGEARARSILKPEEVTKTYKFDGAEVALPRAVTALGRPGEFLVVATGEDGADSPRKLASRGTFSRTGGGLAKSRSSQRLMPSQSLAAFLPKLNLEKAQFMDTRPQFWDQNIKLSERAQQQQSQQSLEAASRAKTPALSARSSVTRSLRQIASQQDRVVLIQASKLMNSALRQSVASGPVVNPGFAAQQAVDRYAGQSGTQTARLPMQPGGDDFGQVDAGLPQVNEHPAQAQSTRTVTAGTNAPRLAHTVSRFLDRVGQRTIQVQDPAAKSGLQGQRAAAEQSQHTYKVNSSKYSQRLAEAVVSARGRYPQKPALVVRQRHLLKEQDTRSPFLADYSAVKPELAEGASLDDFTPSAVPRDSSGAPKKASFLALEAFDPRPEGDPAELLEVYKDPSDGRCYAQSRWAFQDDRAAEMRRCEVLDYRHDQGNFRIRWLHNRACKRASRFNLVFERENVESLRWRQRVASEQRALGDLLMKYHYMLDNTRVRGAVRVPDEAKTRISYRIASMSPYVRIAQLVAGSLPEQKPPQHGVQLTESVPRRLLQPLELPSRAIEQIHGDLGVQGLSFETLSSLFDELDLANLACFKRVQFEAELPFSEEKYLLFRSIIPPEKFLPIGERGQNGGLERGVIAIEERCLPFEEVFARIESKLQVASPSKFEILAETHERLSRLATQEFFNFTQRKALTCTDFIYRSQVGANSLIDQLKEHMRDSQYKLEAMLAKEAQAVREINEQRRRALTHKSDMFVQERVPAQVYERIGELATVINLHFESGLRDCFERSIASLQTHLKTQIELVEHVLSRQLAEPGVEMTPEEFSVVSHDAALDRRVKRESFQLEMTLVYRKSTAAIELRPSCRDLETQMLGYIEELASNLKALPCLQTSETGFARQGEPLGKSKVFPDCMVDYVPTVLSQVTEQLEALLRLPQSLEAQLSQYTSILAQDSKKYGSWLKEPEHGLEVFAGELARLQAARDHVDELLFEDPLCIGPYVVNCNAFRAQLAQKVEDLNSKLFKRVKKSMSRTCAEIEVEVDRTIAVLDNRELLAIEELVEVKEFVKDLPAARKGIGEIIKAVNRQLALLEQYHCKRTEEEVQQTWLSFSAPLRIPEHELDCKLHMEEKEKEFFQDLRAMNEDLARELEESKLDFEVLQGYEALQEHATAASRCELLAEKLEDCARIAALSRRRERLFDVRESDFEEQVVKLEEAFAPYRTLWAHARSYFDKIHLWMKGPLVDIDRDLLTKDIIDTSARLLQLGRVDFKERRAIAQVAFDLRKLYDSFRPYLPLVCALRSPHLKSRHWESIVELRTPPLEIDSDLHQSLEEIIDIGAMQLVEEINEISHYAARERKLEEQVSAMKDEWRNVKFEIVEYADSGTYLLHKPEPVWDLLDEHILKTMAITGSPYVKFLRSEVNYWKNTLVRVQEVLEEWGRLQRTWLYLQPIFGSPDIQAELPQISAAFLGVDKVWRGAMAAAHANPHVLEACFQARLMESLQSSNETLDRVWRGLSEYLGQKRMAFPRFFFLPNDDLLQILSNAKDPLQVQPHLNKIFEGISRLSFFKDGRSVQGMSSAAGEHVSFSSCVGLMRVDEQAAGGKAKKEPIEQLRPVEAWLKDVEAVMRGSLREHVDKAECASRTQERKEWLFSWPAQVVLALDQCRWTNMVEEEGLRALGETPKALQAVLAAEEEKLSELVDLTRSRRGGEVRDAETLGALIVLGVHSKDVTAALVEAGVKSLEEFEWVSQMRTYVVRGAKPPAGGRGAATQLELEARMVTAVRLHGFEYLGNQPRLVITPLTDRCYRTLMMALQLHLGGAPEGPAGTGKTETTKDLAKALAKQCLVFNCSDQLDVDTMGKFFRGLASCGAWACFDEFNRIEVEVLSVVASQILQIQTALMRRRPAAAFTFDEDTLVLDPSCAVFITMNPGYAGRTELPDNLKTLFRPVAMMVPNYATIAEISLYSFGFQRARELSIKITLALKLASEQLSTQPHYDYGMRAVKSIIQAAGRRKAESPDEDEVHLAYRSIAESSIPKFVAEDVPLFVAILSDLFPGSGARVPDHSQLLGALREACSTQKLEATEEFELKAVQLHQTLQVRHGLMLVGATMAGKSSVLHALAAALALMPEPRQVRVHPINPKAQAIGKLYGDVDPLTHEWSDGILARIVREAATDESTALHWITLDGPVDAVWVENLNTVLDDNKKLCLPSSEIIKFHDRMTTVFEVADLLEASPATVSRCGMVHFTPERLGWRVQVEPWVADLPESLKADWRSGLLTGLIDAVAPAALKWLLSSSQAGSRHLMHKSLSANWLVRAFLKLLEALLLKGHTRASLAIHEQEEKDKLEAKEDAKRLGASNVGGGGKRVRGEVSNTAAHRAADQRAVRRREMADTANQLALAAAWGFGAMLGTVAAKASLSEVLVASIRAHPALAELVAEEDSLVSPGLRLHDHFLDRNTGEWRPWSDRLQAESGPVLEPEESGLPGSSMAELELSSPTQNILVPTSETLRSRFLLDELLRRAVPVCLVGATGSGKSSLVKEFVATGLGPEDWEHGSLVLSATTNASFVQAYVESKLEKQRKGVYGPSVQGKRLLFFLDDLGMPAKERYGAQPPLELLRTLIGEGALFDTKDTSRKSVVSTGFVAAMGLAEGGRQPPSDRLLRHFCLVGLPELPEETMLHVFGTILTQGLREYSDIWRNQAQAMASISVALYGRVRAALLPTPAKAHYQFNVRQVAEVTQGLLMVTSNTVEQSTQKLALLHKLWVHEARRVFTDRLVDEADQQLVEGLLRDVVLQARDALGADVDLSEPEMAPSKLLFCNFAEPGSADYQLAASTVRAQAALSQLISAYNQANPRAQLRGLQLFTYMIEHLGRISRIVLKPRGHGLLVSLGGHGRGVLTKLATFLNDHTLFRAEFSRSYGRTEWLDEMKGLFKRAGIDDERHVFALTATEAAGCPGAIEDVSSITNSGEIPNLFSSDDLEEIRAEVSKVARPGVGVDPLALFAERCRANVHVMLSISPAGDALREHLRLYPALGHCTTIDWFLPWPEEALSSVAIAQLLASPDLGRHVGALMASGQESHAGGASLVGTGGRDRAGPLAELARVFVGIHRCVEEAAVRYEQETGRAVYLTPARCKQALALFAELLTQKAANVDEERHQYLTGVRKLQEANGTIDRLQEELERLGPVLEAKSAAVEAGMARLESEAHDVEESQLAVGEEAQRVGAQKAAAEAIQRECEQRLAEAQPQYEAALLALRTLNVSDFQILKVLLSPPQAIRLALEAACIMLGHKPKMVDQVVGKGGQKVKVPDYWDRSRKLLADYKKFLASLEKYDKDNIPAERIAAMQSYLADPAFVPDKIRQASQAAEGICKWVIAVCKYDAIAKDVRPRRAALAAAQATYDAAAADFAAKEDALVELVRHRDALLAEQAEAAREKQNLVARRDLCVTKLERASALMAALGSERDGWQRAADELAAAKEAVLGDSVLAACFLAYLGPFEGRVRLELVSGPWRTLLSSADGLDAKPFFDLGEAVGDAETMQNWLLGGLPDDKVATENVLIMQQTAHQQWPVLVDPQEQALAFMREHLEHNYVPLKATSPALTRVLEMALARGDAVVCTHIGELEGQPALASLLAREVVTIAGGQYMRLEDAELEYHPDFRLYLVTSLSNPHFSPAVQAKVSVLNFSVTEAGLQAQLLALVCKSECQKEEDEKHRLHRQDLAFRLQKREAERLILRLLREAGDDLLADEALLASLDSSKRLTDDITHKLEAARHLSARIEAARKAFRPVAVHGARLFFAVQSLPALDPLYQFSMSWFRELFKESLVLGEQEVRERDALLRGQHLKQRFRALLFENVSMCLFGQHQLAFAFLMAVRVHESTLGPLAFNEEAEAFRAKLQELDQRSLTKSASVGPRQPGAATSTSKRSDTASQKGSERQPGSERQRATVTQQAQLTILQEEDKLAVPSAQLSYLLTGLLPPGTEKEDRSLPEACAAFLDEKSWTRVLELAAFDVLESLPEDMEKQPQEWKAWMQSSTSSINEWAEAPVPYTDSETPQFASLLLRRALKPECALGATQRYIEKALGPGFVHPVPVSLRELFDTRSKACTPMLLLLTPGSDPMEAVTRLAEARLKGRLPLQISLGKGQAGKARALIDEARAYGGWVVLQNCHLAPSYMPELAMVVDQLQPVVRALHAGFGAETPDPSGRASGPPHPDFRLWLTSSSTPAMPQSILEASIKLTSEPPKGLRASLVRSYRAALNSKSDRELHESSSKPEVWGPLCYSLTMFHAVIRERRKYGALGWNTQYDFNDSDFSVSMRQLHLMVETFDVLPLKALRYLAGECNYGGRVTDDQDRRTLSTLLEDFYNEEVVSMAHGEGYNFTRADDPEASPFNILSKPSAESYLEHVQELPEDGTPLLVGLHPSASIKMALLEVDQLLDHVNAVSRPGGSATTGLSSGDGGSLASRLKMISGLKARAHAPFDEVAIKEKFPFRYEQSMNVVLVQEVARYNRLLEVIHSSLDALALALQGRVVTTAESEATLTSLCSNRVPATWSQRAYPSLKPLASWMDDLCSRTQLLEAWMADGRLPAPLWISGLFFPQSFLTAAKQDYARQYGYPIDMVGLSAEIGPAALPEDALREQAATGAPRVVGLLLEGGYWLEEEQLLDEPRVNTRLQPLPPVRLAPFLLEGTRHASDLPSESQSLYPNRPDAKLYSCPLYRTGERRGTLSTTGHSTNFVMEICLPSLQTPAHWVKRGTALLLASDQ